MSYCTFSGFKTLAYNYLLIHEHTFFGEIEMLLDGAQATPAEVAGELMKSDDAHVSLQGAPNVQASVMVPSPCVRRRRVHQGEVPNEMFKAVNVYVDKRLSCPTLRIKVSNNTNLIKNNEFESHQKLDPAADKLYK
ncbi:hypothetical protein DVH24_042608 [Malus domestica]|uniref:AAA+ ATPase At3g28540-like C-terminal domain-containing protein n=1 Tax=Malus domestica TaxID=3750 RepID=A0A498KMZ0_MALDO|nr:hypothetical protein DVH24_042608 [Malus domestica]